MTTEEIRNMSSDATHSRHEYNIMHDELYRYIISPGYTLLNKSDRKKGKAFDEFYSLDKRTIGEILYKLMELYEVKDLVELFEEIRKRTSESNKVKKKL